MSNQTPSPYDLAGMKKASRSVQRRVALQKGEPVPSFAKPLVTDAEAKQMQERCDKATPGEWEIHLTQNIVIKTRDGIVARPVCSISIHHCYDSDKLQQKHDNADFIAHARTDIPRLLSERERLRDENVELKLKVLAAEVMAKVCDDWVQRNEIDARSALADARLSFGDPYKYPLRDSERERLLAIVRGLATDDAIVLRDDDYTCGICLSEGNTRFGIIHDETCSYRLAIEYMAEVTK